jgi:hypothetical protein
LDYRGRGAGDYGAMIYCGALITIVVDRYGL